MNEQEIKESGEFVSEKELEGLQRAQNKIRENATPAQRQLLAEVDAAFDEVNAEFEERIDKENKLREWSIALCGVPLDMSEIEELQAQLDSVKNGTLFYFSPKRSKGGRVNLVKTAFGTVDRVDRYLMTLEKTVIDITNNSQFTPLKFWDLIGLAFKRAFKRS